MNKFNINTDQFSEFLRLTALKNKVENFEALMNISEDKITISLSSIDKTLNCKGSLYGKFLKIGDLGIDNLTILKNYCNSLKVKELEITKSENKLYLKSGKSKFSCVLRSLQYIENNISNQRFDELVKKYAINPIKLSQDQIKQIISQYKTIKPTEFTISGKDKAIKIKLYSNQNELVTDFDIDTDFKPFQVNMNDVFIDIISLTEGDLSLSFQDNLPTYINYKNNDIDYQYFLAPLKK